MINQTFIDYAALFFIHAIFLFALLKRIKPIFKSYNEYKKTNNFSVMYFDILLLIAIIVIIYFIENSLFQNNYYKDLF
jgi:hypothetical protein